MESIISTFHIDWKIIIAQIINFAVVFVVLYIFALKPLSKLMKERSEKIKKGIDDAKSNADMLKETEIKHEEVLTKARSEANTFFQASKKEAEAKQASMIQDAEGRVAEIIESGKKALEAEKVKMVQDVKREVATLSTLAAEKILSQRQDLNNI